MLNAVVEKGFAIMAGEIVVFNYDGATREYLSQSTEYMAVGVGIPANACMDKPLAAKSGYVVCRNSKLPGGSIWLITVAKPSGTSKRQKPLKSPRLMIIRLILRSKHHQHPTISGTVNAGRLIKQHKRRQKSRKQMPLKQHLSKARVNTSNPCRKL